MIPQLDFTIPWDMRLSKNRKTRHAGKHTYTDPVVRDYLKKMAENLKELNGDQKWKPETKTWVRVMVYRPDFRSDPHNFWDSLADVIKVVIAVGDNYFSCDGIDWELDKSNPRVEVSVWQ